MSRLNAYSTILRHNMDALQGGRTDEEMAHAILMKSPKTWAARKKNPLTLSMDEYLRLCALSDKCIKDPAVMLTEKLI